jgi:hypothetical protein
LEIAPTAEDVAALIGMAEELLLSIPAKS